MKRRFLGVCLVVMLMGAGPLTVQAEEKGADDLVAEGVSKLIDALSVFLDSIPQYETPEVLDNGDIIIRRKHKDEETDEDTDVEETST